MKIRSSIFYLIFFQFLLIEQATAQDLSVTRAEQVGLSSERLSRIKPFMQRYVDENKLAGLITLVARRGKVVHFEKYGMMDQDKPMQSNTIFRIASMTKPITSVAAMMLYEQGLFQLDDPVSKFIPQFKNVKVFTGIDQQGLHLEEQKQQLTIRDLLTHTSGLSYGFDGKIPVDSMYQKANLFAGSPQEMIDRLTQLPLLYQPGSKWNYSVSTDVLGYLVEILSGKRLDQFFKERIFIPLKMKDTDFYVSQEKINRLSALYGLTGNNQLQIIGKPQASVNTKLPTICSGGGGLFSTASDYLIFLQMLLNKGEYGGVRLLGRKTVEMMTSNHIPEEMLPIISSQAALGFGLGFSVITDHPKINIIGSEGEFAWAGAFNTFFWADPKEELILILLTQLSPFLKYGIHNEFKVLSYQAIIDK